MGIVLGTLYERDSGKCQLCNRDIEQDQLFEIDHIVEKAAGGLDIITNLRLVHLACHKARHTQNRVTLAPELIKAVKIARIEKPQDLTKKGLRKYADQQLLASLQDAYMQTGTMANAAANCGMTIDQLRHFRLRYNLPGHILTWVIQ